MFSNLELKSGEEPSRQIFDEELNEDVLQELNETEDPFAMVSEAELEEVKELNNEVIMTNLRVLKLESEQFGHDTDTKALKAHVKEFAKIDKLVN